MTAIDRQRDPAAALIVRPMRESDVEAADRIMRTAFGTFLGAPDPLLVFGDAQYVRPRFAAEPSWAFTAELDGKLVGSTFAARWGSFGFFGPLSVRPNLWDRGIATALMAAVVELFERWQVKQAALFTFPHSPKHIGLYQKFGFWPQYLTPLLEKAPVPGRRGRPGRTFGELAEHERPAALATCRDLTDGIFPGLDLAHEIRATDTQGLGDTLLLEGPDGLAGFAVCHLGAGEAGSGTCYVKFAAARAGAGARDRFDELLDACEALAHARGLKRIVAGVNAARHDAYRRLLARGYRVSFEGVVMQRPNEAGYCRPDVYVLDDLR